MAQGRVPVSRVLLILAAVGCETETFTSEERAALEEMRLRPLPPSPGNRFADDPEAARLGQMFFFDARFSGPIGVGADGTNGGLGAAGRAGLVSCASCHGPAEGGADRRSRGNTSLASGWTGRNTPTVLNAAYFTWLFWDGRKDSLWSQALGPVESPVEHNFTRLEAVHVIAAHYRENYQRVFGPVPDLSDERRFPKQGKPGTPAWAGMTDEDRTTVNRVYSNFGKAIEAYERLLVDKSAPFDRFLGGDLEAMSPAALRGAKLFVGRAGCNECHRGPTLSNGDFENHGVPQAGDRVPAVDRGRYAGIDQVLGDEFNGMGPYADKPQPERLMNLQKLPEDLGAFKTPSLRNVTLTAPYMHTGAFGSLWEVMVWYREAAGTDGFAGTRSSAVRPLRLSNDDLTDLVEFMKALEGDPLPAALVTAPVLP